MCNTSQTDTTAASVFLHLYIFRFSWILMQFHTRDREYDEFLVRACVSCSVFPNARVLCCTLRRQCDINVCVHTQADRQYHHFFYIWVSAVFHRIRLMCAVMCAIEEKKRGCIRRARARSSSMHGFNPL